MKNYLALSLLLGATEAAKIPLTKRDLTIEHLEYQKE